MSLRAIKISLLCLCVTAVATAALLAEATLSQSVRTSAAATNTGVYRIAGTLLLSTDGNPVAPLTVKVFDESGAGEPLAMGTSDTAGNYELTVDRSRLPEALQQRGELQRFVIRVFSRNGVAIKSTEENIEMTSLTNARVDFRLLPSEIEQTRPFVCGYGADGRLSDLIVQLTGQELIAALLGLNNNLPRAQLNTNQQKLLDGFPQEPTEFTCGEGYYSSIKALFEKRGEKHLLEPLRQAFFGSLDEQFVTANFRILYTLRTVHAVPSRIPTSDSELKLPNGESIGYIRAKAKDLPQGNKKVPPIRVQEVGLIAEHALRRFRDRAFKFRNPIPKGKKFDIRIQILWAWGLTDPNPLVNNIVLNNLNTTEKNFATIPHELFHRVQYEYNRTENRAGIYGVIREGGARFIEDSFIDEYNRYVFESRTIFLNPAHSLLATPDSCETPINYAAALLWKYIGEQHTLDTSCNSEPHIGVDAYRQVLESTAGTPTEPFDTLDLRLAASKLPRPSSFDTFSYLDGNQTELETNETIWGNYLIANYVHSNESSPLAERRFVYLEDSDLVTWPFVRFTDDETRVDVKKLARLGIVLKPQNDLKMGRGGSVSLTVIGQLPYAATYYRITPDSSSAPRTLRLSLSGFGTLNDPLVQILSFNSEGVLSDVVRSDRKSYSRNVNMNGVSSIVVIVASRLTGGNYTLRFDEVDGGPDPMITRWNSRRLTEYEIDSRTNREFTSVDLVVDNSITNPSEPGSVVFGVDNKLRIRIHNRGNTTVRNVRLDLQYQAHQSRLNPTHWQPLHNLANVPQAANSIEVAGGASTWLEVDWAPTIASRTGWCVKATIRSQNDLNTDNNLAIGCFNPLSANSSSLKVPVR